MSNTRWDWADNSGSAPHLQRVANATASRSAAAYRAYISHGANCGDGCPGERCAAGDELWQAYEDAKGRPTGGA